MARRTKSESEQTRQAILDAAEIEMQARGVAQASLACIAERAQVTRGAIYWHFADKTALLNAMIARTHLPLRDLRQCLGEHIPGDDPLRLLREMLLHGLQRLTSDAQHQRVCHIVLHRCEAAPDDHPIQALLSPLFDDSRQVLLSLCREIEALGQLRANLAAADAADVIMAFICGNYECVLRHSAVFGQRRDWAPVIDAVLHGLFIDMFRAGPALSIDSRQDALI